MSGVVGIVLGTTVSGGQRKRQEEQEISVTVSLNTGRDRERLPQVDRAD